MYFWHFPRAKQSESNKKKWKPKERRKLFWREKFFFFCFPITKKWDTKRQKKNSQMKYKLYQNTKGNIVFVLVVALNTEHYIVIAQAYQDWLYMMIVCVLVCVWWKMQFIYFHSFNESRRRCRRRSLTFLFIYNIKCIETHFPTTVFIACIKFYFY